MADTGSEGTAAAGGGGGLTAMSRALADIVEKVGASVVRVDDGSRLTATGIVWASEAGVILTTSHGVERDEDLSVVAGNGTRYAATLAGRDPDSDLAVLRIDGGAWAAAPLPAAERAPGDAARVGNLVLALARPGSSGLQATLGIVSARQESETAGAPEYILQTDADLYPGSSGGALVDTEGRVVGVLNRMFGRGVGVALGTPLAARVADALLAHGRVARGYLGIRTQLVALPDRLREALALADGQRRALLIAGVENGSPAEQGGLLLGDTLLGIDGRPVQDVDDLRRHLGRPGQVITLRIVRGGEARELTVTLGAEP